MCCVRQQNKAHLFDFSSENKITANSIVPLHTYSCSNEKNWWECHWRIILFQNICRYLLLMAKKGAARASKYFSLALSICISGFECDVSIHISAFKQNKKMIHENSMYEPLFNWSQNWIIWLYIFFNMQYFEKGLLSCRESKNFFFVFHEGWKP